MSACDRANVAARNICRGEHGFGGRSPTCAGMTAAERSRSFVSTASTSHRSSCSPLAIATSSTRTGSSPTSTPAPPGWRGAGPSRPTRDDRCSRTPLPRRRQRTDGARAQAATFNVHHARNAVDVAVVLLACAGPVVGAMRSGGSCAGAGPYSPATRVVGGSPLRVALARSTSRALASPRSRQRNASRSIANASRAPDAVGCFRSRRTSRDPARRSVEAAQRR